MRIFFRHFLPLLFVGLACAAPSPGKAAVAVAVNVTVAPPPLPVYAQPVIPGPGYLWMPGYWAWGPYGYYWVPGTWVLPPAVGLLWTPGYWGWSDGFYLWHAGYWGPHIGFYGGINYGFGYFGVGYRGGFWDHDEFRYNRAVNNLGSVHITNVYNQTVVNNVHASRVSFNGGRGGSRTQPGAAEQAATRDDHVGPTELQARHEQAAGGNHALLASANHGRPSIAATPQPAAFTGRGIVGARNPGGAARAPAPRSNNAHPASAANTGHAPRNPPHGQGAAPAAHPANAAPHPGGNGGPHSDPHPGNRGGDPHGERHGDNH